MGKLILILGHSKEDKVPKWMTETDFEFEMKFFITETFSKASIDGNEEKLL